MKSRSKKRQLYAKVKLFRESRFWMTDEEYSWEFMRPVGREFGSPDYERLAAIDAAAARTSSSALNPKVSVG